MTSVISGYKYDIFISYRLKDNKGDMWVSEFVEALKTELESTFKEDISVYFDINPNDGLRETHNVNESLKEKLKCLVFIPIISRTYCDPKSFAWEHEFKTFIELASHDQFGLKVKLPNGNVSSRVLPVQIHDLKSADKALVEKVLGAFLRPIEFIYTEPGVNRPLTVKDSEEKNLNKTNYRNQINKVANTIDEIISALMVGPESAVKEQEKLKESVQEVREDEKRIDKEQSVERSKIKFLIPITVFALLIVAGVIAYPKIFKRNTLEQLKASGERICVAVMPFQNMTGDTTWNIWQEGIQNELISSLTNSQELTVRQTETINNLLQGRDPVNYASVTPSLASNISRRIRADFYIYGTIKQAGEKIRINTQLIDPKTEEILRSFEIDGQAREEIIFQVIDSLKRKVRDYLILSKLVSGESVSDREFFYDLSNSPEAFRYYFYGRKAFRKRDYPAARNWFQQALEADSNLLLAVVYISTSYGNQGLYEDAKKWCLRIYRKRDFMPDMMKLVTEWLHASLFETPKEEIRFLKQILEIDEQSTMDRYLLGFKYYELGQYDKAIPEFEKALDLYEKLDSKPMWIYNFTLLGEVYHETEKYRKERKLYKKAEKDFAGDPMLLNRQSILALSKGKAEAAGEYIKHYISALEENSTSEGDIALNLGRLYSNAGLLEEAEKYYQQALSLEPENPDRLHSFAWFLINYERNIDKGIELINRALELSPDEYYMLDTKGWGLYKQGNYQEALEFLQKSWDLLPVYNHEVYLHLEAAKKALAGQKDT